MKKRRKISYEFGHATGCGIEDCHWLGYRFDEAHGFTPTDGESWIGQSLPGTAHGLMTQRGWMTGIWRTPQSVWVSESSGRVYRTGSLALREAPWETTRLGATLLGIWGLDDDLVFTWGQRRGAPVAFVHEPSGWREVATPGLINAVRGSDPALVYAVGMRGLVARWDGTAFEAVASATDEPLCDVFVVDEAELYACSPNGQLLRGGSDGWRELLRFEKPLRCVAKCNGQLWVGAGAAGLHRLEGDRLALVKPNVLAERFDARDKLLITMPGAVVETSDGSKFEALFVSTFEKLAAPEPPTWRA